MANKPLKSIKFPELPDTYTIPQVDPTPTQGSTNAVSSGGVYSALAGKVDAVSGKGLSTNDYSDAEKQKVTDATADLSAMTTATAEDVGKALKAKTVSNGKVTEWEFGETGLPDNSVFYKETEVTRENKLNNRQFFGSGSTSKASVAFSAGDRAELKITTNGNVLTIRLIQNDVTVQTVMDDASHVATTDEIITFTAEHDADTIQVYSKSQSKVTLDILKTLAVELVDKDEQPIPLTKYTLNSEFESAISTLNADINKCIALDNPTEERNVLIERINDTGGTKTIPCVIDQGTALKIVVSTENNGLTIRLKNGDTVVDTVVDDNSYPASTDAVFNVSATGDCDSILLWTRGKYSLNVSTVKNVTGMLTSEGTPVVIDVDQISNLDATRNYELEAYSMKAHRGRMVVGLYLDCGRKYYTQSSIFAILSNMATAGFNTLYLHFSENEGFRFGLDNMSISANGTTYDLSVALGKGVYAYGTPEDNDNYITQTEMTAIITQAKALGIEVVPCFDMPAHMGAILEHFPSFRSSVNKVLDIEDGMAVNFALAIMDKYADYFASVGCKCWNIGADEITAYDFATDTEAADAFVDFCNKAAELIIRHGMLPMLFNDNIGQTNIADRINNGIAVLFWSANNDVYASDIADMGYRILNMNRGVYFSPGTMTPAISNYNLYYPSGKTAPPVDNPCPLGGILSIWYSKANNTEYGKNDGGVWMVDNSAQYIIDFGTIMKTQKKTITAYLSESVTVQAGATTIIPVAIINGLTIKSILNAYIQNQTDLKYLGFSNVSCETDPITEAIKNGTINVTMLNAGTNTISLTTNNSISIEFL